MVYPVVKAYLLHAYCSSQIYSGRCTLSIAVCLSSLYTVYGFTFLLHLCFLSLRLSCTLVNICLGSGLTDIQYKIRLRAVADAVSSFIWFLSFTLFLAASPPTGKSSLSWSYQTKENSTQPHAHRTGVESCSVILCHIHQHASKWWSSQPCKAVDEHIDTSS